MEVGTFFVVNGELFADAVSLEQASCYGEALDHCGHCNFRERLRPANLALAVLRHRTCDAHARTRAVDDRAQLALRSARRTTIARMARICGADCVW